MKRSDGHRNSVAGLDAYAEAVKATGTVTNFFKDRLNHWPMYAAAAGSALALSTSALADIIHNPNHRVTKAGAVFGTGYFSYGARAGTTLFGYGRATVSVFNRRTGSFFRGSRTAGTAYLRVGGAVVASANGNNARALNFGSPITGPFQAPVHPLRLAFGSNERTFFGGTHNFTFGSFAAAYPPVERFEGFLLPNGDRGWLGIEVRGSIPFEVEILDWAIATDGESITAGQSQSPACIPTPIRPCSGGNNGSGGTGGGGGSGGTTVPEPSSLSLSLLAMGSVAVLAWKKLRRERAGQEKTAAK